MADFWSMVKDRRVSTCIAFRADIGTMNKMVCSTRFYNERKLPVNIVVTSLHSTLILAIQFTDAFINLPILKLIWKIVILRVF